MADEGERCNITVAEEKEKGTSEIENCFNGTKVFLTGATGFLGQIFLEKLLRSCYNLDKIYVLVRAKKGKNVQTRFEEIFQGPNFEPLKRLRSNFIEKITVITGDCSLPDLGLSTDDKEKLISEIDIVIHCAATVRFDEKLRLATNINVRSVVDLVQIAKQMKNLKALLYVSTAFSNCPRKIISEKFYEPPIAAEKLFSILNSLDDNKLEQITPILLDEFPNTYVFTKSVAEDYIKNNGKNLPIAVYRPAIVIPSLKEPVAGWIDNVYGATGVLLGAALGVIRSIQGKKENTAELVPADYVINCALAVIWDIASRKSLSNFNINEDESNHFQSNSDELVPVYNCVSSPESKIDWGNFTKYAEKHAVHVPSTLQVWHCFFSLRSTRIGHLLAIFFLHTVPAYIVDFLLLCIGKKPILIAGYKKINKFVEVISYFSSRDWIFTNENVQMLWKKMTKTDQENFKFSMKNFDWDSYFYVYVRGGRLYLLKDPLDTIPQGTIKYYKLLCAHYALMLFLLFVFFKILMIVLGLIF